MPGGRARPALAAALIAAVALAQAGPAAAADDAAAIVATAEEGASAIRFTVSTGAAIRSTPLVRDGLLVVADQAGVVQAVDARSGAPRWRFQAAAAIPSSPASDGTLLFFVARGGRLQALALASGAPRWQRALGADLGADHYWDDTVSSPVVHAGRLFVGSGDGRMRAFDAATGRLLWTHDAGARIRATAAVGAGRVVFGTAAGHVVAVREGDGALLWDFASDGAGRTFADRGNDTTSIVAAPTIAGDSVFVGGRDGFFYALDLQRGTLRWRGTHDGASWILSTASDGRRLYVGSGSAQIVQAVDPASGAQIWRAPTRGAVFAPLRVADGALLQIDFSGTLSALDTATGRPLWRFPMAGPAFAAPVAAGGLVYAASDHGVLYAIAIARRPAAVQAVPRRIAFRAGKASAAAFGWFQNGVDDAVFERLRGAGYETPDAAELLAFLHAHRRGAAPAVVVFTDNRTPPALAADDDDGPSPLRRFLDAGGKVVLLGPNPLAFVTDPASGALLEVDYAVPRRVFDVPYPEPGLSGGYSASRPTAAGRRAGLRHDAIAANAIGPAAGVTPYAVDEFGRATAWLRAYGGPPGTGLLQLSVHRQEVPDLAELRAVIEHGVGW